MNWLKEKLNKDLCLGTWTTFGSSGIAELAAKSGFDWVLVDCEHGTGGFTDMLNQLQAMGEYTSPMVRISEINSAEIKKALDGGAAGIIAPMVQTKEEAELLVASTKYPPIGIRGMAGAVRACDFGYDETYAKAANERIVVVAQIESEQAVYNIEEIASVDGIDVLFVGPSDLSLSLGIHRQTDHPKYQYAVSKVFKACKKYNKIPGTLTKDKEGLKAARKQGFKFIGAGIDIVNLKEIYCGIVDSAKNEVCRDLM